MVDFLDFNKNNRIDNDEIEISEKLLELKIREDKTQTKKLMSWVALLSMVIFVFFLLTPLISTEKIKALSELFGLYFISVSGIVASFFGVSAWTSNSAINNSSHEHTLRYSGKYTGSKRIDSD